MSPWVPTPADAFRLFLMNLKQPYEVKLGHKNGWKGYFQHMQIPMATCVATFRKPSA